MKTANYYIFGEIWSLLERLQFIKGIQFEQYDLANPPDVTIIIEQCIQPYYDMASEANKSLIRATFEYYMTTRASPFQELRDSAHDLMLVDDGASDEFLDTVGRALFGDQYLNNIDIRGYLEVLDTRAARCVFDGSNR